MYVYMYILLPEKDFTVPDESGSGRERRLCRVRATMTAVYVV